jgi:hypothetical protein
MARSREATRDLGVVVPHKADKTLYKGNHNSKIGEGWERGSGLG